MCPKGDAGRHGTVGEKGPNGLPVGIPSAVGAAFRFPKTWNPFLGGFTLIFSFRVCKEKLVPRVRREKL